MPLVRMWYVFFTAHLFLIKFHLSELTEIFSRVTSSSLSDRMSCQSNFYVVCGNCELAADLLSLLFLSQSVIYISSSKSCSSAFRLNSTRIFFVSLYAQYRFYFNIKHINRGSNDA